LELFEGEEKKKGENKKGRTSKIDAEMRGREGNVQLTDSFLRFHLTSSPSLLPPSRITPLHQLPTSFLSPPRP